MVWNKTVRKEGSADSSAKRAEYDTEGDSRRRTETALGCRRDWPSAARHVPGTKTRESCLEAKGEHVAKNVEGDVEQRPQEQIQDYFQRALMRPA